MGGLTLALFHSYSVFINRKVIIDITKKLLTWWECAQPDLCLSSFKSYVCSREHRQVWFLPNKFPGSGWSSCFLYFLVSALRNLYCFIQFQVSLKAERIHVLIMRLLSFSLLQFEAHGWIPVEINPRYVLVTQICFSSFRPNTHHSLPTRPSGFWQISQF